jgi:peptide/nickel transport system substrate-binding protein
MGNRFGVKDFLLMVLMVVIIISMWLSMKQRDREWEVLQSMREQSDTQNRELADLRKLLAQGIRVSGSASSQSAVAEMGDPFKYVKEAEAQKDYATGDWFIDNLQSKVGVLTPLVSTDLYATIVQGRVLESLAYEDPNTLEYVPLLATSWQISPDGLTFTFQLRRGVVFSDGEPFTADDVIFTFDWIMNPAVQAPRDRAYLEKVKSVEKHGDYEVVFHLREPYFQSLDLTAGLNILAKHFYSKFKPAQFNQNPGLLIGTGPYKLRDPQSWRPGQKIELLRNDQYWGETPSFDRIIYEQVETEAASLTMFRNAEVDTFAAQPEQYRLLMKDKDFVDHSQHFELDSPLGGYIYIGWNQKRDGKATVFADKRVRTAMTLLTDRQRICDEVMLGYARVADGPFDPLGKPQRAPGLQPLPYDPDKAKELLKEAGFEDRNGSGVLQGPDGQPFTFKLTYPSKIATYERVVLFIKDSYAKAGVKVELDPTDFSIMIDRINKRDFDVVSLGWSGAAEDDLYQIFDSSQIKDEGDDFISYVNPELDKLIEEARSTVDESKRMKLWQQCSQIIHEDQPYTFLYRSKSLLFMAPRIKDVSTSKLGLNAIQRYNMPLPWYVPKALQKWGKQAQ